MISTEGETNTALFLLWSENTLISGSSWLTDNSYHEDLFLKKWVFAGTVHQYEILTQLTLNFEQTPITSYPRKMSGVEGFSTDQLNFYLKFTGKLQPDYLMYYDNITANLDADSLLVTGLNYTFPKVIAGVYFEDLKSTNTFT